MRELARRLRFVLAALAGLALTVTAVSWPAASPSPVHAGIPVRAVLSAAILHAETGAGAGAGGDGGQLAGELARRRGLGQPRGLSQPRARGAHGCLPSRRAG